MTVPMTTAEEEQSKLWEEWLRVNYGSDIPGNVNYPTDPQQKSRLIDDMIEMCKRNGYGPLVPLPGVDIEAWAVKWKDLHGWAQTAVVSSGTLEMRVKLLENAVATLTKKVAGLVGK
jgi:hypothetical protein